MLVVTDNNPQLTSALAKGLGLQMFALRRDIGFDSLSLDEALIKALTNLNTLLLIADHRISEMGVSNKSISKI